MHDFSVLVLNGAQPSSVSLTLDILSTAAELASRQRLFVPRWRVLTTQAGPVSLSHGLTLEGATLDAPTLGDNSLWIVPGLGLSDSMSIHERLVQPDAMKAAEAIRTHVANGGKVAASCSSVFLLQTAGVLAGRAATTSWWLAHQLQQRQPDCRVDASRMVIADGQIITGGAALAQTDLMLYLLRAQIAPKIADDVRRALLLDQRQSQASYIAPAWLAHGNTWIAELVRYIEAALPNPPSVAQLALHFAMSERTLNRRVKQAIGQAPSALIQRVRLQRARSMLEHSRLGLDAIAHAVGYSDASSLRRLLQQTTGSNPSHFRQGTPRA